MTAIPDRIFYREMSEPAMYAAAVTPSDVTVFLQNTRALYVGVTGDVAVVMGGSSTTITFTNVPVGILPVRCSQVYSTGTTATGIIALN